MNSKVFIGLLLSIITITSCSETKTNNAAATYKYWAGTKAPAEVELLNGQYWQSAHFTKEYIMYLNFKANNNWWEEFVKQNTLVMDTKNIARPTNAPTWFTAFANSIKCYKPDELNQDSRYFRDSLTGICYIYEIQL